MIEKDGYRISPTKVEELLMGHPDVYEVVVYGVAGKTANSEMVAMVTAKPKLDIQVLRKFCRHRAPEYLIPDSLGHGSICPKSIIVGATTDIWVASDFTTRH